MSGDARWLLGWVISSVAGVTIIAGGLVLGVLFRESSPAGNFASITDLALGVAGFSITIYTMIETQRISREAQKKIEEAADRASKAVEAAQEESRRILRIVCKELVHSDRATLLVLLKGLREAARQHRWDRALFCAEESPRFATRIAVVPGLDPEVSRQLRGWADDIRTIHSWILNYRMEQQPGELKPAHMAIIAAAIAQLETIEAQSMSGALEGR